MLVTKVLWWSLIIVDTLLLSALSIGAAKLAPLLSQSKVKKGIDIVVGMVMFVIAISLARGIIN
nr:MULTISPECIES: LysE family transporter [Vibrio]